MSVGTYITCVIIDCILEKIQNVNNDLHLLSNGMFAKVVLHDLDLFFQGQTFEMLVSRKWRELAKKCKR